MKLLIPLLLIACSVLFPSVALAQQDPAEPYHVQAGPYLIEVTATASNLSLGSVQYAIWVHSAQDRQPVSNARVLVRARHSEGGEQGWANALNTPVSPAQYTGRIELDGPGVWEMSVDVSSPLGRVEVEIPSQTVPEPRQSREGSLVFIGVFVVLILGGVYLTWTIRRTQRKREALDES